MIDRLDFRSLVSGLRSPRGEERGLIFPSLSDTLYTDALIHCLSQYNRAYLIHCITHWAQIISQHISTSESTWRHHMEVDNDFIYVDLMDTAGEVNYQENFHN